MTYDGNRLVKCDDAVASQPTYNAAHHFQDLADSAVEYEYDGNGNMTKDLNRNISSISYNLLNLASPNLGCVSGIQTKTPCFACNSAQLALNLPTMINFGDNSFIKYTYSATGEKLGVGISPISSVIRICLLVALPLTLSRTMRFLRSV